MARPMTRDDLARLAVAARSFLDELDGYAAQRNDPGFDCSEGLKRIHDAARNLNLALDGRKTVFDPLPEPDPLPGFRARVYAGEEEQDITEGVELQGGVIHSVMPELLRLFGLRDPRERGRKVGADWEQYLRLSGIPSVFGVTPRDEDGQIAGSALKRAVERLEALAVKWPIEVETPTATATKLPPQGDNRARGEPSTSDEYIPFGKALEITGLIAYQLCKATREGGSVRSIGKGKGKKRVHELDARRYAEAEKAKKFRDDCEPKSETEINTIEARKLAEQAKKRRQDGNKRRR
jgi:hypothetical protein